MDQQAYTYTFPGNDGRGVIVWTTLCTHATSPYTICNRLAPLNRQPNLNQVTSRSMGRLSATQSEICRDVNNDAAFNLVTDIFAESLTQADEEAKKKACCGCGEIHGDVWGWLVKPEPSWRKRRGRRSKRGQTISLWMKKPVFIGLKRGNRLQKIHRIFSSHHVSAMSMSVCSYWHVLNKS